jgi:hypothetical protein
MLRIEQNLANAMPLQLVDWQTVIPCSHRAGVQPQLLTPNPWRYEALMQLHKLKAQYTAYNKFSSNPRTLLFYY